MRARLGVVGFGLALASVALAASSGPIQFAPTGDAVWVVNPDSNTVARIDPTTNARTGELPVGQRPRSVAVTAAGVYVTSQTDDTVERLAPDGSPLGPPVDLGFGCAPYGIVANAAGDELYVACQGPSTLVVLGNDLAIKRTITLPWPEGRGLALGPDGKVYVSHFITKEPNNDGHVSEVDPAAGAVSRVLAIPADFATCETRASGQGIANLLEAMAIAPAGAPAAVAGQLWVGGTLHNVQRKGLFERSRFFRDQAGIALFPMLDFQSNPTGEGDNARRNIYKPAFHDIARAVIWKIDLASGESRGRLDVDNGGRIVGLAFSSDGTTAYAVDEIANGLYAFATSRGANGNPASLFGRVARKGAGGVAPGTACGWQPDETDPEEPHILAPQARLVPTGGMNPLDALTLTTVATGLDYAVGLGAMVDVPDGVGTTPIGLALAPGGTHAYVAAYLARKVTVVAATPAGFRCQASPAAPCTTRRDCPGGGECMPLVEKVIGSTASDPVLPEILDGKILFSTSARDAAGVNAPIPAWNDLATDGTTLQGEVVSTARDGGSLACNSCHPDFGGQDGRTWDFSQFGSSLRNTMDLRGRASFAPGTCAHDGAIACTTDAECRVTGGSTARCAANPIFVPPNVSANPAIRANYFNPMGSTHWNADRDEVEDFEFTFRELLGAADCDGNEHSPEQCVGALIVRRFVAGPPVDVRVDLSPEPNRHRSERLDHLADFVYSLTTFPRNPNLGSAGAAPSEASERGRRLFNDPVVKCSFCHNSAPPSPQQFSDKKPAVDYDPNQTPRADLNNPFLVHDVSTANVFDETNPLRIASDEDGLLGFTLFQNEQNMIPGNRDTLNAYITSVLNDVWNTAPYLHDGTAATLLDVVRPCLPQFGDCRTASKGRNFNDQHGVTSFLSARQLNDLAAFEAAAHGPIVEAIGVHGTVLTIRKFRVRFAKRSGTDTVALAAIASLTSDQTFDPATSPVVLSVGVPHGARMDVVAWEFAPGELTGRNGRYRFNDRKGRAKSGLRRLALVVKSGRLTVKAAARTDLAVLRGTTTDWTLAIEAGSDVAAVTRPFKSNRRGTLVKGP
ncbi:MAG: YncE family protein [Candidatus Binatia bacterium]